MHNEFKNGSKVIVCGPGENDGKIYINRTAIILERDPYYMDYHVKFKDGVDDWILPKYIRKPYARNKRKGKRKYEN